MSSLRNKKNFDQIYVNSIKKTVFEKNHYHSAEPNMAALKTILWCWKSLNQLKSFCYSNSL